METITQIKKLSLWIFIIPFLIPFLLMMAIGPKLKWIKSQLEDKIYLISFLIISILLAFLVLKNFNQNFECRDEITIENRQPSYSK